MVGGLLAYSHKAGDEETASGLRENAHFLAVEGVEFRLGVELAYHVHLVFVLAQHQVECGGLTGAYVEYLRGGQHIAVGHAHAGHQLIGAFVDGHAVLEGVAPAGALAHVYLALLKVEQAGHTLVDAGDGEVAVVFGVLNDGGGGVAQHQGACGGCLLHGRVEVHVHPAAVFPILHLRGDIVLAGLDVEAARQVYKEDVARAAVGGAAAPHAHGGLRDALGLGVGIQVYVLAHPFHQQGGVFLHLLDVLGLELLAQELLEGTDDELVLHTRAQLLALGVEVVFQYVVLHVAQVLVAQRAEQGAGAR